MSQTLYFGGDILTMEQPLYAEAVLTQDGEIRAVGSLRQLKELAATDVLQIDLEGKTMLPAFLDAHSHVTALAQTLGMVSLEQATGFADIIRLLKAFRQTQKITAGRWIIGFGYDHNFLEEGRHPDRFVLDEAVSDCPVLIAHVSGHMGVANTAALREMGIDEKTPDPEGGVIGRAEDGFPNGYLEENAFIAQSARLDKPDAKQQMRQLEEAQDIYLKHGITTIQDGITKAEDWVLLHEAAVSGRLKTDIVSYLDLRGASSLLEENRQYLNQYHNRLKIGGYKIFLDGSPQGRTAWLSEPYTDGGSGYPIYSDEQVLAFLEQADRAGTQLLCHCNGDAAAQQLLRCCKQCGGVNRPVMIHAQLVREDQLSKMAEIGMIASFFTAHTYYWGDIHRKNLGDGRAFRISPALTAIRNNVVYTFHQDTPVLAPDVMMTIWCAVNRVSKNGVKMGEGECITPLEALRGVTINAAYQYFEEDSKGSIRAGKRADFVILSENPLKVDPMRIKEIKVLQTICAGKAMLPE